MDIDFFVYLLWVVPFSSSSLSALSSPILNIKFRFAASPINGRNVNDLFVGILAANCPDSEVRNPEAATAAALSQAPKNRMENEKNVQRGNMIFFFVARAFRKMVSKPGPGARKIQISL